MRASITYSKRDIANRSRHIIAMISLVLALTIIITGCSQQEKQIESQNQAVAVSYSMDYEGQTEKGPTYAAFRVANEAVSECVSLTEAPSDENPVQCFSLEPGDYYIEMVVPPLLEDDMTFDIVPYFKGGLVELNGTDSGHLDISLDDAKLVKLSKDLIVNEVEEYKYPCKRIASTYEEFAPTSQTNIEMHERCKRKIARYDELLTRLEKASASDSLHELYAQFCCITADIPKSLVSFGY